LLVSGLLFSLLWISGCQSDLDISLPESEPVYVVEGWIEQDNFPRVLISETMGFDNTIGTADLYSIVNTDAQVRLKTENDEELLSLVKDTMYTELPIYRGYRIKGEIGKSYTIEVKLGDKVFTSTDTIQQEIPIDSIWFQAEGGRDGDGNIHIIFTDPPELGQYYRIMAKRLGLDPDYTNLSANIVGDNLFNGQEIQLPLIRTISPLELDPNRHFSPGQTVVIKLMVMTALRYTFHSSVYDQVSSSYSPVNLQSRTISLMDGGALGAWCNILVNEIH